MNYIFACIRHFPGRDDIKVILENEHKIFLSWGFVYLQNGHFEAFWQKCGTYQI